MAEPAAQVCGIPARHQTATLQHTQLDGGIASRGDDIIEGVFQGNRVIMGSLVLEGEGGSYYYTM